MRKSALTLLLLACAFAARAAAQVPENGGPYNVTFLEGGVGVERQLKGAERLVAAGAPFHIYAWVRPAANADQRGMTELISLGRGLGRALMLHDGYFAYSGGTTVFTVAPVAPGRWTHLAVSSDGKSVTLYADGRSLVTTPAKVSSASSSISLAPVRDFMPHFGGSLVDATVGEGALTDGEVEALVRARPNFDLVQMWNVGVGWEWQSRANTGLWQQQDPWTLPHGRGGFSAPVAKPVVERPVLEPLGDDRWQLNGWRLAAAPDVSADGATLSRPGFDASRWYVATVPGTVLTTLVDRGVYPDPFYGLNNMAIPESLARQDYWYRTSFHVPAEAAGKRLLLVLNGVNYASEVWLNGRLLGNTVGAFIRGQFYVNPSAGENVLAVRVMPPPHPGIPHEQSIRGGVGENGGQLAIDGPTFVATEGWDWIPGIRDRNTGLWLPVELKAFGAVRILDPQVITDLPLPRTDAADIYINVPVANGGGGAPRRVTVRAAFDDVSVERAVTVGANVETVRFSPAEFPRLRLKNPRLWWPNGYGEPALHTLRLTVLDAGRPSDTAQLRFGIREVSYDLSLFDGAGRLRRVNVQTADGKLRGERLIDVRHEAIKQSPRGWVESLTAAGERSPAVTDAVKDWLPEPHLAIRVNGVRIAARGGSWGMDDALKRSGRERLEPYFRLHREAHLNVIRNWMGTNTEPQFYDLADEYGLMILNDFWQSTQNFQVEPQDPQLFLRNARDAVSRYRNHPSIVLWFGRNEGVPYPLLNEGLDDLIFELDGTRWYTGSSNVVNLQGSGPYNYRPPAGYFTNLATGFSVEVGTPSFATLESVKAYVPAQDLWPLSDTLAYHDWHFAGNGDTKTFMQALEEMFGAARDFEDFERKAQMMNLETHKAMYEGFLGHLWTANSGRLLWMTHPSWPSNAWQIYSWDYDTHAAYYGAKKATEPLHVQLNLPHNELVVVNTTLRDENNLTATTRVVSLENRELFARTDRVDAKANSATELAQVPLDSLFEKNAVVLVALRLADGTGRVVSENFYWRGREAASYRALDKLAQAPLELKASAPKVEGGDRVVDVTLSNRTGTPALNAKLTLVDDKGARILPAFYTDNYVALLPGETKTLTVRYPASVTSPVSLRLRGWNVAPAEVRAGR
ncbi:MAG: beta galactosidase jelly roll domain-containing protein [Acidobacteria bacterium]|nr:beta galactosidase jelly roll domain-containing protein [Acidobacteriota bacterium]